MQLDAVDSPYGLHLIVNEPNHILPSYSFCTDLIYTDQPNLVINFEIYPSLNENCHYQITYFN